MAHIAVVNDDTEFLTLMSQLLEMEGHQTMIVREANAAFDTLKAEQPDLVILDIRLDNPHMGWTICEMLTLDPETRKIPVIICSAALDSLREREDWLRRHGIGALAKPFDIDDLCRAVTTVLETGRPISIGLGPE